VKYSKFPLQFVGHDHSLQHVRVNNMSYYVVGSGSDCSTSWSGLAKLPAGAGLFNYPSLGVSIGGFASATVSDTLLTITFYNEAGTNLYSYSHSPHPRNPDPVVPTSQPTVPPTQSPTNTTNPPRTDPSRLIPVKQISDSTLYSIVFGVGGALLLIGTIVVGVI